MQKLEIQRSICDFGAFTKELFSNRTLIFLWLEIQYSEFRRNSKLFNNKNTFCRWRTWYTRCLEKLQKKIVTRNLWKKKKKKKWETVTGSSFHSNVGGNWKQDINCSYVPTRKVSCTEVRIRYFTDQKGHSCDLRLLKCTAANSTGFTTERWRETFVLVFSAQWKEYDSRIKRTK